MTIYWPRISFFAVFTHQSTSLLLFEALTRVVPRPNADRVAVQGVTEIYTTVVEGHERQTVRQTEKRDVDNNHTTKVG